jgi:hypothetical protein
MDPVRPQRRPGEAEGVHSDLDAMEPKIDSSADWKTVVLLGLLERLRELTDLVHDIIASGARSGRKSRDWRS